MSPGEQRIKTELESLEQWHRFPQGAKQRMRHRQCKVLLVVAVAILSLKGNSGSELSAWASAVQRPRPAHPVSVRTAWGEMMGDDWFSVGEVLQSEENDPDAGEILPSHFLAFSDEEEFTVVRDVGQELERRRQVYKELDRELLVAAEANNVSGIQLTLEMGANVNYGEEVPPTGYTALMLAASAGSIDACRVILSHSADVNQRNVFNATALHYAAASGNTAVCHFLLHRGLFPGLVSQTGGTALEWALEAGQKECAMLLNRFTLPSSLLHRDHPREWLGENAQRFWSSAQELNISFPQEHPDEIEEVATLLDRLSTGGLNQTTWSRLTNHWFADETGEETTGHQRADDSMLLPKFGPRGLRIGEFIDVESGGMDGRFLDMDFGHQGFTYEDLPAYQPSQSGSVRGTPSPSRSRASSASKSRASSESAPRRKSTSRSRGSKGDVSQDSKGGDDAATVPTAVPRAGSKLGKRHHRS